MEDLHSHLCGGLGLTRGVLTIIITRSHYWCTRFQLFLEITNLVNFLLKHTWGHPPHAPRMPQPKAVHNCSQKSPYCCQIELTGSPTPYNQVTQTPTKATALLLVVFSIMYFFIILHYTTGGLVLSGEFFLQLYWVFLYLFTFIPSTE